MNAAENLLTLKQIAEQVGVTYGRLRGFADAPGVKEAVGAVEPPGVKGVRYEPFALDLFRALIAAQDAGETEPKQAAAWLLRRQSGAAEAEGDNSPGDAPLGELGGALAKLASTPVSGPVAAEMIRTMRDLTDALRESTAASSGPVEHFYTLAGAVAETGLSAKTIRNTVPAIKDGGRKKYAASDLKAAARSIPRYAPVKALPRPVAAPPETVSQNSDTDDTEEQD